MSRRRAYLALSFAAVCAGRLSLSRRILPALLAATLTPVWSWAAAGPPLPGPTPPPGIYLSRAQVLEAQTMREYKRMVVGKDYVLRIDTNGLSHVANNANLDYGGFINKTYVKRRVDFRLDPSQAASAWIPVNPATDVEWEFTLPDTVQHYDRGTLRLAVSYKKQGSDIQLSFFNYYELADDTAEMAFVVNDGPPVASVFPGIGYIGSAKSDAQIQGLLADLQSRFLSATKGYVDMVYTYDGRTSWPADGQVFAGGLHDYVSWWNGLSHNLSGTDLLPLDPSDPEDLEMIKLAWYSAGRQAQLWDDADALLAGPQSIMLLEAFYGASVAPGFTAYSALYNSWPFQQNANGGTQWGIHQNFGWLDPEHQHKITLHEYGHTKSMGHPAQSCFPNCATWTVKTSTLEGYVNVMGDGNLTGYPTGYLDTDIVRFTPLSEPTLAIPDVTPIGDPVTASQWTLKGKKDPGAGLAVNGQEVIPVGDPASSWAVLVNLSLGQNRFEVAQRMVLNGDLRQSHPNILLTTRLGPTVLPSTPQVQFTEISPTSYQPISLGEQLRFTLDAKAAAGVQEIAWWVEKADPGFKLVRNMNNLRKVYGSVTAKHQYHVAFDQVGTYRIRARAMTLSQTSPLAEISFDVVP